ncbi:MAG: Homoserine kinase [Candidatus Tokpelaia hoelldobleri]|uniref:Homoserine kinase n=1 Tax=Candidatus Tokpelaia hoelldobleri TaxID=1902579 RepID=A0A1U9JW35_9HYPH|nr:MAG: Homoserine kinase [Candidatus Tokpelaia hoelldoblerii]
MAVYTDVSAEALEVFLQDYSIGGLLSCKGIAEGVENSNYLLQTQSGSYILTLYEKRVRQGDLPFFLGLMQHLAQKKLECPLPVVRKDGALFGELAGRPAAIITFLQGMSTGSPEIVCCRGAGAALAKFHRAGSDFALSRENSLSVSGWRVLWQPIRARVAAELADEIDRGLDWLTCDWPQGLPKGVIHADLFPDNVFFLGKEVSGLIDFYFACNDFYAYDLAICLNAWCFEKDLSFNQAKAAAMFAAYNRERALGPDECEALPLLACGAAMRFFLTRLYDWFHVANDVLVVKKDANEYLHKYRFFRQIVHPSELGIL